MSFIENAFGKWWGKLFIILLFFMPSYSTVSFSPEQTPSVVVAVLQNPLIYQNPSVYGSLKILLLAVLILLVLTGGKSIKIFSFYAATLYLVSAIFQNSANTNEYGFVFLIGNFILMLIIAALWVLQGVKNQDNRLRLRVGYHRYWLGALSLLAFWFPVDSTGSAFDFTLSGFLVNEAMVSACMIIPVTLFVAVQFCQRINLLTIRVTAFIGIIFGITNMIVWFILNQEMWVMGVLHLPLFLVSTYVLILYGLLARVSNTSANKDDKLEHI